MNAKLLCNSSFSIIMTVFALLLSACAARSTSIVVQEAPAVKEVQVEKVVEAEKQAQPAAVEPAARSQTAAHPGAAGGRAHPALPPEQEIMPTPADTFFQNYGTNPYQTILQDHLSTFALDVDTASYT